MRKSNARVGDRPRGRKRRCPGCGLKKLASQFKPGDSEGRCARCRDKGYRVKKAADRERLVEEVAPAWETSAHGEWFEIKLGQARVLRVRVVGGVVALTSGRIEERKVREDWGLARGNHDHGWKVASATESFVECSTITVPLRLLEKLRAALSKIARIHPTS